MHLFSRISLLIFALGSCFIILQYFPSNSFNLYKEVIIFKSIIQTSVANHSQVVIPRNIIQTGARHNSGHFLSQSFKRLNPNHSYLFFDDSQAKEFVHKHMSPEVIHTYEILPVPVLKADYFRYISIYVLGGVYSDLDTECIRPIDTWTDNFTNVSFIVGIEAEGSPEIHGIARPLQLCQWTFAAVPKHPILKRMIDKIQEQTKILLNKKLSLSVIMNWTGPGLWTDIIFDYINEKYHVEWPTLSGLQRNRLIGDIFIVPVPGFAPGHFGAKGRSNKEVRVWHSFHGSWKGGLSKT